MVATASLEVSLTLTSWCPCAYGLVRILMGSLPSVKSKWAAEATKQRESYYVTSRPHQLLCIL